jgi:hypothetical protein
MLRVHGGVGFENVDVYITIYRRVCIGEEKSRGPLTTNDCTTDGLDGVAIGVPLGMTSNRRSLDDSRPVEEGQRRWRGGTSVEREAVLGRTILRAVCSIQG